MNDSWGPETLTLLIAILSMVGTGLGTLIGTVVLLYREQRTREWLEKDRDEKRKADNEEREAQRKAAHDERTALAASVHEERVLLAAKVQREAEHVAAKLELERLRLSAELLRASSLADKRLRGVASGIHRGLDSTRDAAQAAYHEANGLKATIADVLLQNAKTGDATLKAVLAQEERGDEVTREILDTTKGTAEKIEHDHPTETSPQP